MRVQGDGVQASATRVDRAGTYVGTDASAYMR